MKLNRFALALSTAAVIGRVRALLTPRPALTLKLQTGADRVAAVAKYMHEQATSMRAGYEEFSMFPSLQAEAAMHLAGAAAADAMGDLLLAIVTGDKDAAKAVLHSFVNDAVDGGIVTV